MSNYNRRDNDIFGTNTAPSQDSYQRKAQTQSRQQDNDIFGQRPAHENAQRKAQIQNRRDNDIFGTGPVQDDSTHRTQLQNRNASSFNIIGFDPNSPVSNKKGEQIAKKEKQNQYRDELNQMVHDKQERKQTNPYSHGKGNVETVGSDYGNYYGHGKSQQYQQEDPYSKQYQRGGDNYQQEYRQEEDFRASSEQEKKRKLQQEMLQANKKAVEEKQAQKKRQSEMESYEDSRRLQDSLQRYERDDLRQQESKKRLQEENNQVLYQQRADYNYQKNAQKMDKLSSDMGGMNMGGEPLRERYQSDLPSDYSSNKVTSAQTDYQKNRDKNRYGGSYNIINNEYS